MIERQLVTEEESLVCCHRFHHLRGKRNRRLAFHAIDQFIDRRDVKRTLRLHQFNDQPYYLAAFLIGAYQEILGDLHNLFGDTNTVHVDLSATGEVVIEAMVKGDTVREVLDYVEFEPSDLITRLQTAVETAVRENRLSHQEAGRFLKFYEEALNGYTYLEEPGD